MLTGCSMPTSPSPGPLTTAFYVLRREPPALLQLSPENKILHEIPIAIPSGCAVDSVFAPPRGAQLAIQYECAFGQAVVWLNTETGEARQPVTDSDSHFMAWARDGQFAYLKVDTVNRPHIVRAPLVGKPRYTPITELSYDLAPKPGSNSDFLFSFSRGMGLGSEMWYARSGGQVVQQVIADAHNYISLARWSPDGSKIAFIKIPDSRTPFTVGDLWVMQADGSAARKLADADAGHGFAPAWSPDGSSLAFVVRENPGDLQADQNADALRSNIALFNLLTGTLSKLTQFQDGRAETPAWSPDGNRLAFSAVLNDKMTVYVVQTKSGEGQPVLSVPVCCPVWIQK